MVVSLFLRTFALRKQQSIKAFVKRYNLALYTMKLMTKQIEKALLKAPLYFTDGTPLEEKKVICKFFHPITKWRWYVFEGNKLDNGDFEFFGMVHGFDKEMGYFTLSELENLPKRFGLGVERDLSVFNEPYKNFMNE